MLTGIEIAGIVLAVTPLFISVLEHHEAELRPFEALLKYHKMYKRSAQDLGVCFLQLEQTMIDLFRDARISDNQRDVKALVQAYDSTAWNNDEHRGKLIAYFGKEAYERGFEVKLSRMCDDVEAISKILGLGDFGKPDSDESGRGYNMPSTLRKSAGILATAKLLRSRARFIFKSSSIDKHLKSLGNHIQWLADAAERQTSASSPSGWGRKPARHQDTTFVPPLDQIEDYAQRLHTALRHVWTCPQHDVHHVNLRLDQRLRSRDTSGCASTPGTASFTLAFAPNADATAWHTAEVTVADSTQSGLVQSTRVRFSVGPNTTNTGSVGPQEHGVHTFCAWTSQGGTAEKRLYLNESNTFVQRGQGGPPVSQQRRRVSLTSLLHQPRDPPGGGSLLTTAQAISLGTIVVSSFLQLYTTHWLAGTWCSDDLYFLKSGDAINTHEAYVTMAHSSAATYPAQVVQDDGEIFIRLGTMLLEIWAQTSIESLRARDQTATNLTGAARLLQDLHIIREHLKRFRGTMEPCFLQAINYCMQAFAIGKPDIRDPGTRIQVIKDVLSPFEEDLYYWESARTSVRLF